MARRWLVTLAMFVVTCPFAAAADDGVFRVDLAERKVTTSTAPLAKLEPRTPLSGIVSEGRADGDVYVKTNGDLAAIAKDGSIRWVRPATATGSIAIIRSPGGAVTIVDGWVDRTTHRYGIVSYDPIDGRQVASVDLGATGGWYDVERIHVAPDGPGEVLVSALFGVD